MKVLKLNLKKFRSSAVLAVEALKEGKVLVCPTDTVYGLICVADEKEAVERLYKIKRRPPNKPIPVFVSNIKMAKVIAKINNKQEEFLKKVWPGPVTVVLGKKRGGSVGIRVPNHSWLLCLVERLGRGLAETSANISGKPAPTKIKEVLKQFKRHKYQPDLVIDAGNLLKAKPSKVIDLTVFPFKILRP